MRQRVFNCSRQTLIAWEVEVVGTAWDRMRGLIGRSPEEFRPGRGLLISPSEGIHTIGMSFPIDVVYLDSDHRVIQVYHRLRPFRFGSVRFKAKSVLELPAGTLKESRTEVGDLLQFGEGQGAGGANCAAK